MKKLYYWKTLIVKMESVRFRLFNKKKEIVMLNSIELLERGIITGDIPKENVQQVGIDLNVIKIQEIPGIAGTVYRSRTDVTPYLDKEPEGGIWRLEPGTYFVTFKQGCNIPNNIMLLIRQRSSLLRMGTILHSSVFDPGFETQNMSSMIVVDKTIFIEEGARIAQIYGHPCNEVDPEHMYNGQFQGK